MLFFLLACGDDSKDTGVSEEDAALWEEISDYSDWQQLENWTGVNPSDSVHGVAMQTWYNDTAYDGLMQGEETMPNGSIIVKRVFSLLLRNIIHKSNLIEAMISFEFYLEDCYRENLFLWFVN